MVTKQVGNRTEPSVSKLREAVKRVPKCKQVMEFIASDRERARAETAFPSLQRNEAMRDIKLDNNDLHAIFNSLQEAGAGIKQMSNGKTSYTLFRWAFNMQDVALAALGKKLPKGHFRAPVFKLEAVAETHTSMDAIGLNMAKQGTSAIAESFIPSATAAPNIVRIRTVAFGRAVEVEIDLSKVPADAYISIKPV